MGTKSRIPSFDFARALCTIGIIYFHFTQASLCPDLRMDLGHLDAGWGYLFVTVFFMISGALLYYQHEEIAQIRMFYKRRWLSIFPSFYSVYIPLYLFLALRHKSFFFRGHPLNIILSILGLDGYLYATVEDYYLIGEWFLGAILLIYLLYPLILKMFNRFTLFTWIMSLIMLVFFSERSLWAVSPLANLFSCLVSFITGMLIMKYHLYRNMQIAGASFIFLLVLQFADLPVNANILMHLAGFALFFIIVWIGELLTINKRFARTSENICSITYEIFLIHHIIIINILQWKNPDDVWSAMILLLFSNMIIIPCAWLLKAFVLKVTHNARMMCN